MTTDVKHNIEHVRERIARAAANAGRRAEDVTLIAVSKTQPVELIEEARAAGVVDFGENRVQEALRKFAAPGSTAEAGRQVPRQNISLHMIGTLQRNKAREAAGQFDYIQSVDRLELLSDLDHAALIVRHGLSLPVMLEVNLTGESSKGGITKEGLPRLADALGDRTNLRGVGLMTIARMGAREQELRETFSTLRELLTVLKSSFPGDWQHLSMGMSDDYEYAIEEGATMVRIGRAIFGERTAGR